MIINRGKELENVMNDFLNGVSPLIEDEFVLKGCMALKKHIDNDADIRLTRDIDFSVKSIDGWEDFILKGCVLASNNSQNNLVYSVVNRRSFDKNPKGDSLTIKFEGIDVEGKFKIDMNINPEDLSFSIKIGDLILKVYSIYGILSDKITVCSSRKICRRIKDMIDLYYICTNMDFNIGVLRSSMKNIKIEDYFLNCDNYKEIEHAYNKYDLSSVMKPEFGELYLTVLAFMLPILTENKTKLNIENSLYWHKDIKGWRKD